jgi:phosphate/sulfate permease
MIAGFLLASYSIVTNDAIQTLGTFLSSNNQRPWWLLWLFASSILTAVFVYGWLTYSGDVSYGRLDFIPVPKPFSWIYLIPPLVLLLLTQFGIPVSTTFLILTVFAPQALGDMLLKSLWGYLLAFGLSFFIYKLVTTQLESHFLVTQNKEIKPLWIVVQWLSTGFLWSQWLIQDFANIFAYLPRHINISWLIFSLLFMLLIIAVVFYNQGGNIQKVVNSKTNTQDIRSATFVDFIYGFILLFFKEYSQVPMSTTWVFIGLLSGRELAMTLNFNQRTLQETAHLIAADALKALLGLTVSIILAFGLPLFHY